MRICVIGLGYIGLPTAAVFANSGADVLGVDVFADVVDTINDGRTHIVEPDLDEVVSSVVASGHLVASLTPSVADVFLIAVPTPFKSENHDPDLSHIEAACQMIAPYLTSGATVILESTSPVGATEQISKWLAAARQDLSFPLKSDDVSDIRIAYCPERVLPGQIMQELIKNDRVVGGITPTCAKSAAAVYQTIVTGQCIETNARTAEMVKLTENGFRDVNIAFANELSMICERLKIEVQDLIALANLHPRVNILQPGPGVGGHCIAVDPWFIVNKTPDIAELIRTARLVNDAKPAWVVDQILARHDSQEPLILYGLAYKADVDDLRESPAVAIARLLRDKLSKDASIQLVEPFVDKPPKALNGMRLESLGETLEGPGTRVLLVPHTQFKEHSDLLKSLGTLDFCNGLGQ